MASLAGRSLVSSYKELLKLNNLTPNSGVSASLQTVEDGFAGATALQLSSAGIASTGTLAVAGDLAVNTNKFNVTAASGNTSIAGSLTATGDLAVNTNKFNVTAANGNTAVAGTLAVTGASTLNALSATTGAFSSTLSATGNLAVNTNKFTVTAASGDTAVAGTLSAVGDFAINTNKFTVTAASGNVSSAGTLNVAGNLNVNTSKFNVVASTGNTSISGTLTVADTVDFASTGAMRIPRGTAGQRPAGDTGMLRFNTNTQSFEGHNGVAWGAIGGSGGVGTSQYVRQTFVATAGQTSFTVTGGYTPDSVDVFQNGVKLVNGSGNDVTITSGTVVVLATGAAAGDVIDVIGLASGNFAGPATAKRQNFTATAGQTVFTVTGGYTPNQLDVFQNGTKLVTSVDVDVSNGSTFTLTTPAVLGDNLEVVGFTAANTIAGTLKFQAGTAAAPSITRFENENTGIFFPAADTIAFSKGGAEAMRIDSSGNVGVGTTSPSAQIHVNGIGSNSRFYTNGDAVGGTLFLQNTGDGSGGQILFGTQQGVTSGIKGFTVNGTGPAGHLIFQTRSTSGNVLERMTIDSSGNVGIGTAIPATQLQINSSATTYSDQLRIRNTNYGNADIGVGSGIMAIATDNANITFHTSSNLGTTGSAVPSNERLRIDTNGNVGIGTTSPVNKISVESSGANSSEIDISLVSGTGNKECIVNFGKNLATTDRYLGRIFYQVDNNVMGFNTNNTERLRIDSSGNVGIGTSPSGRLHVAAAQNQMLFQSTTLTNFLLNSYANGNSVILYMGVEGSSSGRTDINATLDNASFFGSRTDHPVQFISNNSARMTIDSSGNVLIGAADSNIQGGNVGFKFVYNATNPYMGIVSDLSANSTNYHLYNRNATNSGYRFYVNLNGGITNFSANNVNASDERLKTNISPAGNYLDKICSIPVKTFNYKDQGEDTEKTIGIIAQEVEAVIPELINNDGFGETPADGIPLKTIYQTDLQYVLMRCIQELSAKVTALEAA